MNSQPEMPIPDTPQLLLEHHLKALRLPTILREYDKVARQCAEEKADFPRYLLRLTELELLDRDRRATERRIRQAGVPTDRSSSVGWRRSSPWSRPSTPSTSWPSHRPTRRWCWIWLGASSSPARRTCCCSATVALARRILRWLSVWPPVSAASRKPDREIVERVEHRPLPLFGASIGRIENSVKSPDFCGSARFATGVEGSSRCRFDRKTNSTEDARTRGPGPAAQNMVGGNMVMALAQIAEQAPSIEQLLTAEAVAERLKVSRDWVWDHSSRRLPYLPVIRMSDGALRYRASQIEEFLSERERVSNLRRKRR
jgi:predicted DNA-binding transcriptional regulator AlpA